MAFKIRNTPLKAFAKSPLKQHDIDTRWVDQIYTKDRVDRDLIKKGHHTEGDLRGKVNTDPKEGRYIGGTQRIIGPRDMY